MARLGCNLGAYSRSLAAICSCKLGDLRVLASEHAATKRAAKASLSKVGRDLREKSGVYPMRHISVMGKLTVDVNK